MKNLLKWLAIAGGICIVLVIAAVIIVPKIVNIEKYKPVFEQKVTEATGRSFTIGDDIDLSVFPWVGVKLSDLHFGNPKGFGQKDMVSVKTFEVRLKVMPLLSKQIEVKTFVMDAPMIYLEKLKDGRVNWEGLSKEKTGTEKKKKVESPKEGSDALPLEGLNVGTFSITNGQLKFVDQAAGVKKDITDVNLILTDVSLDKPVGISFKASADGKPVSLEGTAGPVGKQPGKGDLNLDLVLKALDLLQVDVKGNVTDPASALSMDLNVEIKPFSPKKLLAALDQKLPVTPKDAGVLEKFAFKSNIKGTTKNIRLSNGSIVLDDSTISFSASAKEFSKPDLAFDIRLDAIDLDRYLPETQKQEKTKKKKADAASKSTGGKKQAKTDYTPLRKLILDGKFAVGNLKAANAKVQDLLVHVKAKNGIITVDPMDMKLYQGNVDAALGLNVQKQTPATRLKLKASGIQAGPLLKDAMKKEVIEGGLTSDIDIRMTGDTPESIKQTLSGKGNLSFTDGAIIGIDLAQSVRNVSSKLGMAENSSEKPKTDFAELKIPFTAEKGLVRIDGTSLLSPLLRVTASGTANLAKEILDLRVDPKFVATLKGQGDTKDRSGVSVPVLITGSFDSPKIRPDVKGMLTGGAGGLDPNALKKKLTGSKESPDDAIKETKEVLQNQLKGLFKSFGN